MSRDWYQPISKLNLKEMPFDFVALEMNFKDQLKEPVIS